jgi:hypothetical protein
MERNTHGLKRIEKRLDGATLCGIVEVRLYGSTSQAEFTITGAIAGTGARNKAPTLAKGKRLALGIVRVWMVRNDW